MKGYTIGRCAVSLADSNSVERGRENVVIGYVWPSANGLWRYAITDKIMSPPEGVPTDGVSVSQAEAAERVWDIYQAALQGWLDDRR